MGGDEDWKKAAMVDDTVVAEMLLKLNQTTVPKPSPLQQQQATNPMPAFPLEWSVRQRRSKSVTIVNSDKRVAPRASPTTPLSWSGATSISGGGGGGGASGSGGGIDGGSEESSKPQPSSHPIKLADTKRSKVSSETATGKRPRKKKTLAELKEDEIVLLKERRQLKKDLITLRVNLEKERATSEKLKKMKVDVQSHMANESGMNVSTSGASDPLPVPTIIPAHIASSQTSPPESSCQRQKEAAKFVLPDLNLPFEDDFNTKVLCGAS